MPTDNSHLASDHHQAATFDDFGNNSAIVMAFEDVFAEVQQLVTDSIEDLRSIRDRLARINEDFAAQVIAGEITSDCLHYIISREDCTVELSDLHELTAELLELKEATAECGAYLFDE